MIRVVNILQYKRFILKGHIRDAFNDSNFPSFIEVLNVETSNVSVAGKLIYKERQWVIVHQSYFSTSNIDNSYNTCEVLAIELVLVFSSVFSNTRQLPLLLIISEFVYFPSRLRLNGWYTACALNNK